MSWMEVFLAWLTVTVNSVILHPCRRKVVFKSYFLILWAEWKPSFWKRLVFNLDFFANHLISSVLVNFRTHFIWLTQGLLPDPSMVHADSNRWQIVSFLWSIEVPNLQQSLFIFCWGVSLLPKWWCEESNLFSGKFSVLSTSEVPEEGQGWGATRWRSWQWGRCWQGEAAAWKITAAKERTMECLLARQKCSPQCL